MPMKYAIVIPDGAADEPVAKLEGKTPLQVARKPNIDWIAANGHQGCVVTVPKGFLPGSDVAIMSLLGYDPAVCYSGRAPLEAAARGISTLADQLIFRCNFVTVVDGLMEDFTAGHISQAESVRLIAELNNHLGGDQCEFHPGISYRNLMVASVSAEVKPTCTPPHDFPGQPVAKHLPKGPGSEWVKGIMDRARGVLERHEVNFVRRDLGENPASDIWLWGQGRPKVFESFLSRFGLSGAVIAAVDLIRGFAKNAGLEVIDVPGATGYLDTDYAAKGAAAVDALDSFDLVIVHVEAPDEAGHLGNVDEKIKAIEQVDQHVVGPVLEKLRSFARWKILVAADHPTPVERKIHTATPPPFCIAGHAVQAVLGEQLSEPTARASDLKIDPAHELMEYFLRK
ncbi:MAG: cofactor-independent phosphoglycerate mutase [Phycisphaerales bacterium]|nr:MAG: cofactor-independent phosphoglycerate mutase [Phycisphaerales bacterium]